MHKTLFLTSIISLWILSTLMAQQTNYTMPSEEALHEGTWLQWPHHHEYGYFYRDNLDPTWVAMTQALVSSENVHIIAYDGAEQTRITNLLTAAGVPMTKIDFTLLPTNDVWVRDNGPIYVRDQNNDLVITDWGFNGWGGDYNFDHCNAIPSGVAATTGTPTLNLQDILVLEGGSLELDGNGVLMATQSSILSQSNPPGVYSIRNPGMTTAQCEAILSQYLGVSKFIWLDGYFSPDDITDAHIDGIMKFAHGNTIVTMNQADLSYWGLSNGDINTLYGATDINNTPYTYVYLPLTQNDVVTTYGNNLGYKGCYINYYVANSVVLVPNYNDPNDSVANGIIQSLYPNKTVVGIDVRNLYENGGMLHCVTQQQPADLATQSDMQVGDTSIELFPNPTAGQFVIDGDFQSYNIQILDANGQVFEHLSNQPAPINIDISSLPVGLYFIKVGHQNHPHLRIEKMLKF